ncbi:MAG: alginate export family protein [Flavobacteriales bacterium]
MKKQIAHFIFLTLGFTFVGAQQLDVDLEIRPRYEYNHGAKTLAPENTDPDNTIDQRSRLNIGYKHDKVQVYFTLQDVRIWGEEINTMNNTSVRSVDNAMTEIHQAWAKINLGKKYAFKFGRQEIALDDHRILGNVGWAQQARAFDAGVFKANYENGWKADLGFAFNQTDNLFTNGSIHEGVDFKSMQYLWLHKDFKNLKASFLAMNTGWQSEDLTTGDAKSGTQNRQTWGTHLKYNQGGLAVTGNFYYQSGEDRKERDISAWLIGMDAQYKFKNNFSVGAGGEYQSGTDYDENNKNNSFNPLFGTNHKFNGLIDYFYVGNHINNVGLIDLYAKVGYAKNKWFVKGAVHSFSAPADMSADSKSHLGMEMDITAGYKYTKDIKFQAGYSQMFESEGMEQLKNVNNPADFNNWGYLMITVNPRIFSKKLDF